MGKASRPGSCSRGPWHRYTPEEIQFIKDNLPGCSYAEMTGLFNRKFKCLTTMKKISALIYRNKLRNGLNNDQKAIGTEMIDSRGYTLVKIANPDMWKPKHVIVWKKAHGEIPKGHIIIFADGDKSNFDLDNLLLVSRSELAMMNHQKLIFPDTELTKAGKVVADMYLLIASREREIGMRCKRRKKRNESMVGTENEGDGKQRSWKHLSK
jgi:hypothetical protein